MPGFAGVTRLAGRLVVGGGVAAAVAIAAIMLVMVIEVFARYVVGRPTTWALEVVSYLLVASTCLGAGYTLRVHAHIAVDVVRKLFPRPMQQVLYRLTLLVVIACALILIIWGIEDVHRSMRLGDVSLTPLAMPLWIPQLSIPAGSTLLLLQALVLLFDRRIYSESVDPELDAIEDAVR